MNRRNTFLFFLWMANLVCFPAAVFAQENDATDTLRESTDPLREAQAAAVKKKKGDGFRWGNDENQLSNWTNHSNRLIPVYTFGITLDRWREQGSVYQRKETLKSLYGVETTRTYNPVATYYDQTDIYSLQKQVLDKGYTHIIMMVFDGMDWQTTRAAALYAQPERSKLAGQNGYPSGRGAGLPFQDYRGAVNDFGWVVTSAASKKAKHDVDTQQVLSIDLGAGGGYDVDRGGMYPWHENSQRNYLLGLDRAVPHYVTDSAASATSLFSGVKTYNGSINVLGDGTQVVPIARELQAEQDWRVGIVTSVPLSHATVASAYANNVSRKDYQDIARDLIGLPSSAHRDPLRGVDVLLGGGWGESKKTDELQGSNFRPGNPYLHEEDFQNVSMEKDGEYVVVQRQAGINGKESLMKAAERAVELDARLLGLYGVKGGHLPYRTADGNYDPTLDVNPAETYSEADVNENPSLAEMTEAALRTLEPAIDGFWLLIEAGDVDWANHSNNLDNSVGAVLSGADAFEVVIDWVEANEAWDRAAVIVTADHGHFLVIEDESKLRDAGRRARSSNAKKNEATISESIENSKP